MDAMEILGVPAATWFPVVTLILGVALKGVADAIADGRALRREREARREQRRDAIQMRRAEFQRATLLELQEAAANLTRFTARANHHDVMAHNAGASWSKQLLPDELNEGLRNAQATLSKLTVRVRDDAVRRIAEALSSVCGDVVLANSRAAADEAFQRVADVLPALQDRIGVVLRSLEDDEDAVL